MITRARQKQLDNVYDILIQVCLYDRPLEDMEPYLAEDVMNFGAGRKEITRTKAAFLEQIKNQKELAAGIKMEFQFTPVLRKIINDGNGAIYSDDIINTVWINGEATKLSFRLSFIFEYTGDQWMLVHSHTSAPDSQRTDDEVWPVEELKKRTAVLEKSLDEKIAELEIKNRELKIEAALERVRAQAMGMQKPEDLAAVSNIVFTELKALGFSKLRNTEIIINKDEKESILSYYYSDYGIAGTIEVLYNQNPVLKKWADDMQQAVDAFVAIAIPENEMDAWRKYREEIGYMPDPKLNEARTVFYYSYSIGLGALSVSTWEPVSDDQLKTLERFRNVFGLAYRRYADVAQAEAQAREAQIQLSMERVRARTMAMQRSEELGGVADLLFKQIEELGVTSWNCGFNIWDEDKSFTTSFNGSKSGISRPFKVPSSEDVFLHFYEAAQKGESLYIEEIGGEACAAHYRYLAALPGVSEIVKEYAAAGVVFPTYQIFHIAYFAQGYLMFITFEPVPQLYDIFKRFAKVFEQTYTRFLDLRKAEEQARKAKIEAALERTRTQSMLMQHSDELDYTLRVFHEQVLLLGINSAFSFLWLPDEKNDRHVFWAAWAENANNLLGNKNAAVFKSKAINYPLDRNEPATAQCLIDWKGKEPVVSYHVPPAGIETYFSAWQELIAGVEHLKPEYFSDGLYYVEAFMKHGCFGVMVRAALPDEEKAILYRFAIEFERAYTRFLDLQKAEAQAREAQIEAALERVRSRSMSMQKSEELKEVINVVYEQFVHLNINIDHTGFVLDYKVRNDYHIWLADKLAVPSQVTIPYFDCLYYNRFNEAKEKGTDFFAVNLSFEEKNSFYQKLLAFVPGIPEESKEFLFTCPGLAVSTVLLENICLYIENFTGIPYSDEENAILMRFGKVFQQAYTRFLDLQKAEVQAREAQIEAALERVRSRAMAMQKTDELIDAADLLGKEISALGINSMNVTYAIVGDGEKTVNYYSVNPLDGKVLPYAFVFPQTETEVMRSIFSSWQRQEPFNIIELDEEATLAHQTWAGVQIKKLLEEKGIPFSVDEFLKISPREAVIYTFNFARGYLFLIGGGRLSKVQEEIFLRITKVFDLTYRRFLDLKQAESQAREAKIEASLERVRSRTMGMQHSHELQDASQLMFQQVQELGIQQWACGYNIWGENRKTCMAWMSAKGVIQTPFETPSSENVFLHFYEAALSGEDLYVEEISGETCIAHYKYLSTLPVAGDVMKEWEAAGISHPTHQVFHIAYFKQGYLMFITYESVPEAHEIFKRFAKVFEQTYTRFLDLQKAESQALETLKRASVDRVRAEIASMRTTSDLEKITPLIWNELTTLGVPFIRCGVFIMDEEEQQVNTYLSNPEGKAIAAFHQPYNSPGDIGEVVKCWRKKEMYTRHWDEAMFVEVTKNLVQQGSITSGEKYLTENHPTDLYLHFLPFLQGMLYVGNTSLLTDDALQLVQNLADAFSTAYARYEDFNKLEAAKEQVDKTLTDLKQTQAQLVQAEKMASLGELTAGIAHEIQNPLNFVNNFSELSNELIDEMQVEMGKGNINEVKQLADDIRSNLEKINLHGKRADAIVKGMLQHSRTTSGEKLPTDINALADEYLRLAYHGLRAKDKSFNATLVTDFDQGITRVNIIPQDIGRVILNLISNAFYAVDEKKKSATENFEPTVSVMTKNVNGHIEIMVRDNGKGISKKVMEKIFQPFFTTKPTGQGTGLGLSLAYDIVKAHGGEIKVETKEREGSCFTISIPNN